MIDLRLLEAVKNGDHVIAEQMITTGADVNQQDEHGWTPLNFAAGKGDIFLVKLLVENGADIDKIGRDMRTPYMIALAAGQVSVVKYLRGVEGNFPRERPSRSPRKYCKAYYLKDLRKYPAWSENRINWKRNTEGGDVTASGLTEDKVVFIHQDLTVTESVWHGENVIFENVHPDWEAFCANILKFRVPDDLDLIAPSGS